VEHLFSVQIYFLDATIWDDTSVERFRLKLLGFLDDDDCRLMGGARDAIDTTGRCAEL